MIEILSQTSRIFAAEAAPESAGGISALGVDGKALLLQIVTFVIVFLLLKKFALDKIVTTLEERRKTIDRGVSLGLKMAKEKEQLDAKVDSIVNKARSEADKIIAAGHHDVGILLKEAEASAARKTDVLIADAHAKIEEDIQRARKDLEKETLQLVAEATETVIGQKLDKSKDNQLIERALQGAKR